MFTEHGWRSAPTLRLVSGAMFLVLVSLFVLSGPRSIVVQKGQFIAGVDAGCITIGRDPYRNFVDGFDLQSLPTWNSGFAAAWRPFRAGGRAGYRLVFPLWQPMLAAGLLAACAHGFVAGKRRGDRSRCMHCGYDLTRLPKGADRRCPECGSSETRAVPDAERAA